MCFLVISRSGLFIFVYVKPHLLIFSNTSFRLYSHSTPTLSLCQSSTTTIHLYPTTTLRSMLTYMFIFYNLFDTYFVYFFINSLTQLFCLNFSTPISASIFFFFNHVPQQLNNLFHFSFLQPFANKQPSNSFFLATSLPTAFFCFLLSSIFNSFIALFPSPLFFLDQMCCLPTTHLGGEPCRGSVVPSSRYSVYVIFITYCI